ncbi:TraB/GumN family protein [Brevundimonas sp.]|uniref:TraB/GumN family protein n=1 Tax=Brevundimonas sp. TaxID=1871086 RepID=UPI0028A09EB5|nr:TraB/GumN family protein [Brevundimonas sp.]
MKASLAVMAVSLLLSLSPVTALAMAQDNRDDPENLTEDAPSQVEEIVVVARRAGLPIWTVRRGDEGVLILAGMIREVPKDFEWRAQALEDAVTRSDRVLFAQEGRASPADIFRIIWRSRTIAILPDDTRAADYLSVEDMARLTALMAGQRNDNWQRTSFLLTAIELIKDKGGEKDAKSPRIERAVERAARRAGVKTHHIGVVRGNELVETLISAPPQTHIPCLDAAMSVAEYGPTAVSDRAAAWSRLDVKGVLASPVDLAMDVCWPWGDPEVRPRARAEWVNAISTAIADEGVTLAVAPVRTLGEAGGVLDMLVAAGFEIDGPDWK